MTALGDWVRAYSRALERRNREEMDRVFNPPKLPLCRVCRQPARHSNPFRGVECDEHYRIAEEAETAQILASRAVQPARTRQGSVDRDPASALSQNGQGE